ncbi:MAG TPA: hypothetical protein VGD69_05750 [Herpetosiphonaceae bacterium]
MSDQPFTNPNTAAIVDFLRTIGLDVRVEPLPETTFLPGIWIERGALVVDEARLRYPGDLLHEAGHLAVAAPERRATITGDAGSDPAEEMMAIAWSYAAAVQMGLDPAVVFHNDGYQGGGSSIVENFSQGRFFGVPMLQWLGMTVDPAQSGSRGLEPFPHMLQWLRTVSIPADAQAEADV